MSFTAETTHGAAEDGEARRSSGRARRGGRDGKAVRGNRNSWTLGRERRCFTTRKLELRSG
ncbi:hypothetical protein E2C01_033516 [Portunus trituberculatus]|uniref:Uncharacterized protein n=1 Tax=Portunus trituberculatus TaxID=210409 RepID=A0A5B7F5Q2_PORTR|nr:hypothetical protein [Portunus trituberculatus]